MRASGGEFFARRAACALAALALGCDGTVAGGAATRGALDATTRDAASGGRDSALDDGQVPRSLGSVTFRLTAPADGGFGYLSSLGDPGDGYWWYSVATADGGALPIFFAGNSSTAICSPCTYLGDGVALGFGCGPAPDGGPVATWNGMVVPGTGGTCFLEAGLEGIAPGEVPCIDVDYVPKGSYVVTMCGLKDCDNYPGDAGVVCTSVAFDYPAESEVVGRLP